MSAPDSHLPADHGSIPASVMDELIAWSVKLSSGLATAEDELRFQQWRAQEAVHEMAWRKLNGMEQSLRNVPASSRTIITQTIALVDEQSRASAKRKKAFKQIGLSAVAFCAIAIFVNQTGPWRQQTHLATAVGQQSTFTLSDGTQLTLNTNSSVDIHYALFKREIVLHTGEIYLQTGKDPQGLFGRRPFWVNTQQAALEAIGTRFSVYQKDTNTLLHVTEGIVAMHSGQHAPVRAYANESYSLQGAASAPVKADVQDATAWLDGVIVAKQMPLDALVTELSRYQALPVHFDADIGKLKVSGVFQLHRADPTEHALQTIAQTLPIRVARQNNSIVITRK